MEKGIPLAAGYKILKTHEPELCLSRSNALFVTLFEIEVTRRTSIKKHKALTTPLFRLMAKYCPWSPTMPLGVYFALGMIVLPDPKAFLFGRSKFRKKLAHDDPLSKYKRPPLARRLAAEAATLPRRAYHALKGGLAFARRGGRPERANASKYLKAYYDRLEDERVHGNRRRSLIRTQKFHIDVAPAPPDATCAAPPEPGSPLARPLYP